MSIRMCDRNGFPIDLIRVGKFTTLGQMNAVRKVLSDRGITSYVENEDELTLPARRSLSPSHSLAPSEGVELFIASRDWISASKILRQPQPALSLDADEFCPRCGSTDINVPRFPWMQLVAAVLSFPMGLLMLSGFTTQCQCLRCGNRWPRASRPSSKKSSSPGGFPVMPRRKSIDPSPATPETLIAATEHLTNRRVARRPAPRPQPVASKTELHHEALVEIPHS